MIAAIAPPQHRVLRGGPFHIAARQVIEQDVELRGKQLAVARGEMPLERRLVWQR